MPYFSKLTIKDETTAVAKYFKNHEYTENKVYNIQFLEGEPYSGSTSSAEDYETVVATDTNTGVTIRYEKDDIAYYCKPQFVPYIEAVCTKDYFTPRQAVTSGLFKVLYFNIPNSDGEIIPSTDYSVYPANAPDEIGKYEGYQITCNTTGKKYDGLTCGCDVPTYEDITYDYTGLYSIGTVKCTFYGSGDDALQEHNAIDKYYLVSNDTKPIQIFARFSSLDIAQSIVEEELTSDIFNFSDNTLSWNSKTKDECLFMYDIDEPIVTFVLNSTCDRRDEGIERNSFTLSKTIVVETPTIYANRYYWTNYGQRSYEPIPLYGSKSWTLPEGTSYISKTPDEYAPEKIINGIYTYTRCDKSEEGKHYHYSEITRTAWNGTEYYEKDHALKNETVGTEASGHPAKVVANIYYMRTEQPQCQVTFKAYSSVDTGTRHDIWSNTYTFYRGEEINLANYFDSEIIVSNQEYSRQIYDETYTCTCQIKYLLDQTLSQYTIPDSPTDTIEIEYDNAIVYPNIELTRHLIDGSQIRDISESFTQESWALDTTVNMTDLIDEYSEYSDYTFKSASPVEQGMSFTLGDGNRYTIGQPNTQNITFIYKKNN